MTLTYSMQMKFKAPLIAILSLVFLPNIVFADYSAFQNHLTSTSGPDNVNNAMVSCGTECYIEYIATSTITQFDRLDVALCRNDGSTGGVFELEVRSTASTTGPIIASSTLAINDGNIYSTTTTPGQGCNYGIEGVNKHMSTFVLNNNIQTVAGVTWWFRLRPVGNASTIMVSLNNGNTFGFGNNLYYWLSNAPYKTNGGVDFASPIVTGYGLGIAPISLGNIMYNASGTPVVCTSFDFGCYISTSLAYLFIPNDVQSAFERMTPIASTSPISLVYEAKSMFDDIYAPQSSTSTVVKVSFLGEDLVIFDSSQIETYLPIAPTIRLILTYFIWLAAFWTVIKIPFHLIFK